MFIKIEDAVAGVKVKTDGGFTCMPKGAVRTIRSDDAGLFIRCGDGKHYLTGQVDDKTGELVGLERAP
jgi:hypothetical protein